MIDLECITVTVKDSEADPLNIKVLTQSYHKGCDDFYAKGFMMNKEILAEGYGNAELKRMMVRAYTELLDRMFKDYKEGVGVFAKTEAKAED